MLDVGIHVNNFIILQHDESDEKRTHGLKSAKNFIQAMRLTCGKRKPKVTSAEVNFNFSLIYI